MAKVIADTILLQSKAKEKLPILTSAGGIFTRRAFEQCSSETLASFKASLFNGKSVLVLAGGLGIDDIAFSRTFEQVYSIELNNQLNIISKLNFNLLNIENINRIEADATAYIENCQQKFDLIYTDPDRRSEDKRQILIRDHAPNVIDLLPKIKKLGNRLLIKCSPLYDYEMAINELENVKRIIAVSMDGEMKELLIECDFENKPDAITLQCTDISPKGTLSWLQNSSESQKDTARDPFTESDSYFYEAGASLVKMRLFLKYANQHQLHTIDPSIPFFTSAELLDPFIGRSFKLVKAFPFSSSILTEYMKQSGISSANIKTRGLKFNTDEIKRKLKVKDGGIDYFFILSSQKNKMVFHCQKI